MVEKPIGKPVVIDLRSDKGRQIEGDARAGKSLGPDVDHLVAELLKEDCTRIRACEIGEALNERGGIDLMRAAYYRVRIVALPGEARSLERAWEGIGDWRE